nr:RNA-directed DNA polymerase, eukaryota, reverse transcriptase zinc-binding domain protein [Tanacetum cinerariifolium]
DFRPISLIGSMYKIIAKILANHLVVVLVDLVNEIQSAFVTDKQILDGPFILNELVQWCKKKKKQSLVFKASKDKGGLGVSSLFALNRALMFKWVWRFITQSSSLWARVIKTFNGEDGKIGKKAKSYYPSIWLDMIHEVMMLILEIQFELLKEKVEGTVLVNMKDKWVWSLEGSGDFSVASVKKFIDDYMLPKVTSKTH